MSSFNLMWNMFYIKNSSFNYKSPRHNVSLAYKYEYDLCDCGGVDGDGSQIMNIKL